MRYLRPEIPTPLEAAVLAALLQGPAGTCELAARLSGYTKVLPTISRVTGKLRARGLIATRTGEPPDRRVHRHTLRLAGLRALREARAFWGQDDSQLVRG